MKNLFIIGAGASVESGAPLMSNFIDYAQDILSYSNKVNTLSSSYEDVFNAIHELRGIHANSYLDLNNIEVLFGIIETGLLLNKFGTRSKEEIIELKKSLITLIYSTLEFSIKFPSQGQAPKPYMDFVNFINKLSNPISNKDIKHEFSFITFNYDLCLDIALKHYKPYDYGLTGVIKNNATPLLKLHGSINWGQNNNKDICPVDVDKIQFNTWGENKGVFYNVGSNLDQFKDGTEPLQGPPIIIPPTWNKNAYHNQVSKLWSLAATEIERAQNIIVIGYSLPETDSFFKYLYAIGSDSKTRLRNFIVIDTDSKCEHRFRNIIGKGIEHRFHFINKPFSNCLDDLKFFLNNIKVT